MAAQGEEGYGHVDFNEVVARTQANTMAGMANMFTLQADRQAAMFAKTAVELDPVQANAIRQNMHRESPIDPVK